MHFTRDNYCQIIPNAKRFTALKTATVLYGAALEVRYNTDDKLLFPSLCHKSRALPLKSAY